MTRGRAASLFLLGYLVVGAADIVGGAAGVRTAEVLTKPLLMPLLIGYVVLAVPDPAPWRLVVTGLAGGALGDTALLFPAGFLVGMAAFAVGHACYIAAFVRAGALARLRRRRWVVGGYAVAWVAMVVALWPGLGALRLPVAAYSLLLVAMAGAAAGSNRVAALGGLLFLASDALLGLRLAAMSLGPSDALIMPTYLLGQLLLTFSWSVIPTPAVVRAPAG